MTRHPLVSALALIVALAAPAAAQPPQAAGLDLQPEQLPYRQLEAVVRAGGCESLAAGSPLLSGAALSRFEAASLLSRCLAQAPVPAMAEVEALRQELAAELTALEVRLDALQGGPGFAPTTRLNGQATFVLGKPATGKPKL